MLIEQIWIQVAWAPWLYAGPAPRKGGISEPWPPKSLFVTHKSLLVTSDGHSGATSTAIFSVAVAAAPLLFFITSDKRQRRCFFRQKSGSALALFINQSFCAAATANKLLPRLFLI